MDKKRLALLEKAFVAEINAGLNGHQLHLIQTKAKLAEVMAEEGLLAKRKVSMAGVAVEGYELTNFGHMTYCTLCPGHAVS